AGGLVSIDVNQSFATATIKRKGRRAALRRSPRARRRLDPQRRPQRKSPAFAPGPRPPLGKIEPLLNRPQIRSTPNAPAMELELLDSKKKMVSGSYLCNAWYVAAWSDDLADGQLLSRTILKEPVVLFRKSDGHLAPLQDRCPHRFAPLHMGKIVD